MVVGLGTLPAVDVLSIRMLATSLYSGAITSFPCYFRPSVGSRWLSRRDTPVQVCEISLADAGLMGVLSIYRSRYSMSKLTKGIDMPRRHLLHSEPPWSSARFRIVFFLIRIPTRYPVPTSRLGVNVFTHIQHWECFVLFWNTMGVLLHS